MKKTISLEDTKESPQKPQLPAKATESEKLDFLNARLRRKRTGANAIRRRMEAQIEAKARKRRRNETPASGMLGGALSKLRG